MLLILRLLARDVIFTNHNGRVAVIRTESPPLESEAVWIGFAETGVANAILRVACKLGRHHEGCQVLEPKTFEFVYTRNR
jgi:hypothetical protein